MPETSDSEQGWPPARKRDRCILDLKLATTKSPLIVLQLIHGSFIALERREIRGAEFIGEGESQPSMLQHMVK